MARGDGTIRQNKTTKNFEGAYTVHKENGTGIRKSFTRKSKQEVKDIMAKLRALGTIDNDIQDIMINRYTNKISFVRKGQDKNSNIELNNGMLLKDYVDYYLFTHRRNGLNGKKIEDTTFTAYVDRCRYIKQALGDKKIAELTFTDIENMLNELHSRTNCDTTAQQVRTFFYSIMKYAKKDGIIQENVLENNNINFKERKRKKEKKILEKEDFAKVVKYCIENKYYDLLMIMYTRSKS